MMERNRTLPYRRKASFLLEGAGKNIDFKDMRLLSRFITERGKILPRRITGLNAQQQRMIAKAIKRARQMSLLPFISYGY
jgi:small subunit ribosomal protein S18